MSDVSDWWRTKIIQMEPGKIAFRGRPIEELIESQSFTDMIWLMVMGFPRVESTSAAPRCRLGCIR
jgi:citrate synthase